jgi:hypothetical protein
LNHRIIEKHAEIYDLQNEREPLLSGKLVNQQSLNRQNDSMIE